MPLSGKRILVVDDEPDMRKLIRDVLRMNRAGVKIATNGKDALAIAEEYPIDMIISDMRMHSGTGLYLLKNIKRTKPKILFVMVTGYDDANEEEARRFGADMFFTKPIDPEAFLDEVTEVLTK